MNAGKRLYEARRRSGKSQQLVADFCGISQAALSRYENGRRRMTVDVCAALAEFYGVSVGELLC